MVEEGFDGAGNDAGQSAGWGDKAFVVIAHAFDNLHRLKMAHDCADVDFSGSSAKRKPPPLPRTLTRNPPLTNEVTTFIKWLWNISKFQQ